MRTSIKPAIAGFLLLMMLVAVGWSAQAATVTLNCTLPTQYTDGTPIGTTPITLKVYWGTSATVLSNTAPLSSCVNGPVTVPDPAPGSTVTYYFAVTPTVNGVEAVKSNVASRAVTTPFPTPKPVTSLVADTGATAYSIKPDYTTFGPMQVNKPVGKLFKQASCIARQRIDGTELYRVPKSAVAFDKGATDYVVAQCRQS